MKKSQLIFYCLFSVLIASVTVFGSLSWLDNFKSNHPDIIEARAADYVEDQPLDGVLLWDEQMLYAPQDGVFTYLSPLPRRVSKGDELAALDGHAVRASYPAYFFPAIDGQEGNWLYARLWPGFGPFPFFIPAVLLENGTVLRRGAPIGKLVPQPQSLRCIAYLDRTPSLERNLKSEKPMIRFKMTQLGKERKAEVVAMEELGKKIKVFLRLPFFPPEFLRSREFKARVVTSSQEGVMVPDSCVITQNGRDYVFLLQGNRLVAQEVDGFPANENSFFIVKGERGIEPGSKLILDASNAREGVLSL